MFSSCLNIQILNFFLAISIRFIGKAKTSWRYTRTRDYYENGSTHTHTEYRTATASETYFNESSILFGSPSNDGISFFGDNSYSFEFPLPLDIPSSFENDLGHIRYTIKAAVEWKNFFWSSHKIKTNFFVNSHVELSRFHQNKVS